MEGPRLKRKRSDSNYGLNMAVTVNLEDEDEDVIFIGEETGPRTSVVNSSTAPTATTLPTVRLILSNLKQSVPLSTLRKSAPIVQSNATPRKAVVKSHTVQHKPSTIQTSLTDFFQSKNPQSGPVSSSSKPSNEERKKQRILSSNSTKQYPPKKEDRKDGKELISMAKQSNNQWEDQMIRNQQVQSNNQWEDHMIRNQQVQSNNQSTLCPTILSSEKVSAFLENKIEKDTNFLNEGELAAQDIQEKFSEEEDYSSGDEFLSNVPEEVFLEAESAVMKPLKKCPKKPILNGEFKNKSGRKCPFYKIMPGTPFSVDAFSFGYVPNVSAYFLSHFHSDHYVGMTSKFQKPVYCSRITANLVKRKIRTDQYWVREIPMNTPSVVEGVEVTLLEANHCPGSCLFLFKLKDGRVYLHTGDFRADPKVLGNDPALTNLREITKLYLDTTYLDPYYEFESQADTVEIAAEFARQAVAKNPKTLVVCGTYSVGKEKIFMRIAEVLKSKVAVTTYKMQLMECFEWRDFEGMLTKEWSFAQVHVLPMQALNVPSLQEHLAKFRNFNAVLAIVPSGWQFNKKTLSLRDIKPKVNGAISILGLPYSEHSSYRELEWFVRFIKPKEVIPTVNVGNPTKREEMAKILKSWMDPAYKPTIAKKQNLITGFFPA